MMSRIHRRRPPRPPRPPRRPGYDAVHPRMRLDPQGVAHASIGVVDRPGTLAREILIQGAAERDVQDLEATTNGEQREAAALGTCDERELDCGAPRDDRGHPREAEDPGAAAGGGAPKSGQRGLLTLVQSTRTPYSGTARSPAVSWPMLGYPVGGRCDS